MKIEFYIGTLLYQHDCVVIPGFGGFIANYASAYIHPVQNTFIPPSRQIMFNASLLHNDGLLATNISSEEGISYTDALNRISAEVFAIHAALNAGNAVVLDGFGSLRTNHEHNVVFTPTSTNNYLEDAYGLPTFVSPAIRRTGYQSNQDVNGKGSGILRLPVAVRRIAAIAVPLIAIGMWSLFHTDQISHFSSNYSSIFPTEILPSFEGNSVKKSISFSTPTTTPTNDNVSVNRSQLLWADNKEAVAKVEPLMLISNPAITAPAITDLKTEAKISTPQPTPIELKEKDHFFVISGAFKSKENAEHRIGQLKAQNFDASLAGQNKSGLYLVSVASCDDANLAEVKKKEILKKGIEAAWILKK